MSKIPVHCQQEKVKIVLPLKMVAIDLPEWGEKFGVKGHLLVPQECVGSPKVENSWEQVDWWLAMFLLLEGWHERLWEQKYGTIHSYSFRLKGWDSRAWDQAWVNRMALFLREWFHVDFKRKDVFLGKLPKAKILLSHDIDAVAKTFPIRLKQTAFNFFNFIRLFLNGKFLISFSYLKKGIRFFLSKNDWWFFNKLLEAEENNNIRAVYNFYADNRRKSLNRWLMDPHYNISSNKLNELFIRLKLKGHEIGIHPTFDCWKDPNLLEKQKSLLESKADVEITKCRQHWLRFSWKDTWDAQSEAGIKEDSTLMFNDRAGFRNSSCITWKPWSTNKNEPCGLRCTTSVIMDSHLYDYETLNASQRSNLIHKLSNEIKSVSGESYYLWHPQTLTKDYGWGDGFDMVLEVITRKDIE